VKRPLRALLAAAAVTATALASAGAGAQAAGTTYPRTGEPVTFQISSFNVLGSSHTAPGERLARLGSGTYRIGLAVKFLDKHGLDVVGFQELQMDQWTEFTRLAGTRYGSYPGGIDRRSVQNSIVWNLDTWRFVEGHTVPIPYFDGIEWGMPVVQLQHTVTGQLAWFANFHNPATNRKHRNSTPFRREAEQRQVALANSLYWETGLPVFFTGDMNEREKYFCTLAGGAPMKAANGGKVTKDGTCTPPPSPMPVNWIFGGKKRGAFSNYVRDDSRLVNRITDHYVVRADVTLPAPPVEEPIEDPVTP
jgi:hypothetical protein